MVFCIKAKPPRPRGNAGFEVRDGCQFESRTGGERGINPPDGQQRRPWNQLFVSGGIFGPLIGFSGDVPILSNLTEVWNNNRELAGPWSQKHILPHHKRNSWMLERRLQGCLDSDTGQASRFLNPIQQQDPLPHWQSVWSDTHAGCSLVSGKCVRALETWLHVHVGKKSASPVRCSDHRNQVSRLRDV